MINNGVIAEILMWGHFIIIITFGIVPFFIPLSIWPNRPLWHFLFIFIVAILGIILAYIYRKKYNIKKYHICFANLITQRVRGYKLNDPRNYTYSHLKDIFKKFKINISPLISAITLFIATVLTVINLAIYLS